MPAGLYTRYDFDADLQSFKSSQDKSRSFENMVVSYFQEMRPDCKIESFCATGTQKTIDCFSADGFCEHCNTMFELMGCFHLYCPCQDARPAQTEEDIQRGIKKKQRDEIWKQYIEEKEYTVVEM